MERSNDKEIEIAFLEARLRDMQNTLSDKPAMVARGVIEACGSNIKDFVDTIPNSKASLTFDIQGRYKLIVEASSESDKLSLSLELPDGSGMERFGKGWDGGYQITNSIQRNNNLY